MVPLAETAVCVVEFLVGMAHELDPDLSNTSSYHNAARSGCVALQDATDVHPDRMKVFQKEPDSEDYVLLVLAIVDCGMTSALASLSRRRRW